jgi:hypothetical protein
MEAHVRNQPNKSVRGRADRNVADNLHNIGSVLNKCFQRQLPTAPNLTGTA